MQMNLQCFVSHNYLGSMRSAPAFMHITSRQPESPCHGPLEEQLSCGMVVAPCWCPL